MGPSGVTVSRGSGVATVYVNGAVAATLDTCVNDHPSNYFDITYYDDLAIGGNIPQLGYDPLQGYLDDLRIYRRCRAAAERRANSGR